MQCYYQPYSELFKKITFLEAYFTTALFFQSGAHKATRSVREAA